VCDRPIELKSDRPIKVSSLGFVHEVLQSKVNVSCSEVEGWRSLLEVPSIEVGILSSEVNVLCSEVGGWRSLLEVSSFEVGG
jgi:hypothetical protein